MNPNLRSMIVSIGVFVVGGAAYVVYQPTPPPRTIAELRDAGMLSGADEKFILVCPEKITAKTVRRLVSLGYCDKRACKAGSIRRIARPVYGFLLPDGGEEVIMPSLRLPFDAGPDDGGGDPDEVDDDSNEFRTDDCYRVECAGFDAGVLGDGGFVYSLADGGQAVFCNGPNRLAMVQPPCVLPNCWSLSDGGWNDNTAPVDCNGIGFLGLPDGGPRWRGCNTIPNGYWQGSACVPVECSVVAGDSPPDVLQ